MSRKRKHAIQQVADETQAAIVAVMRETGPEAAAEWERREEEREARIVAELKKLKAEGKLF
jgi:hypothetical protein